MTMSDEPVPTQGDAPVEPPVLWRAEGAVAVITLNRPERLNAWTPELDQRYFELLDDAAANPNIRAIVVTGAGRGFCAGADMDVLKTIHGEAPPEAAAWMRPRSWVRSVGKPVLAAINGACAGIGLVMAMTCDLRFAAEDAKFTTAFAQRGLVAEYGLAWLLGRALGPSRALDLLLSARVVMAPEAQALGLVDRVYPSGELMDGVMAYATELAERSSPWAMSVIKRQVYEGLESDLPAAERLAEHFMNQSYGRPDLQEGIASFLERRPPRFPSLTEESDAAS